MSNQKTKETKGEQGICPECGDELIYEDIELDGEFIYYWCSCGGCEWEGKEWYATEFDRLTKNN